MNKLTNDELQGNLGGLANTRAIDVLNGLGGFNAFAVLALPPGQRPVAGFNVALVEH